ncbi:MAG TPA: histone deacetylase [Acidimicrobiia bacterium]|nr:histone deacetylase [Acidimicrobiia bacterium]
MLLVATDAHFEEHDAGRGHPERPARVRAVLDGLDAGAPREARVRLAPRRATRHELERVHTAKYLDHLERFCADGGGRLDADTGASAASWEAALLAAGSGLEAVDALDRGDGEFAFCAVRPPGHHAVAEHAMGFCLLNNVAVTAAALRDRGERVLVVDWDAHHGNGTQDIFYGDGAVMYVSLHEWPLYPGTGRLTDSGTGEGAGATVNFPLPSGATGDVYLDAIDTVVEPLVEAFAPSWVLVSAGYDAHRADPLTGLGLSAGDYVDLTARMMAIAAPRRLVVFLEGGYDLDALRDSTAATVSTLIGQPERIEAATAAGPGRTVVDAVRDLHASGPLAGG